MNLLIQETLESKLIEHKGLFVLVDRDVAELYGVETKEINKAVKNNPNKFPEGYILELTKGEKDELVEKFHRFERLKHSTVNPKVFTEKGLYMLATIIKSKVATESTLQIVETYTKVRELSNNINSIIQTSDESLQKKYADKSNKILEEVIDVQSDTLNEDESGELVETTTKFEFTLGFAKISRSIKKVRQ